MLNGTSEITEGGPEELTLLPSLLFSISMGLSLHAKGQVLSLVAYQ